MSFFPLKSHIIILFLCLLPNLIYNNNKNFHLTFFYQLYFCKQSFSLLKTNIFIIYDIKILKTFFTSKLELLSVYLDLFQLEFLSIYYPLLLDKLLLLLVLLFLISFSLTFDYLSFNEEVIIPKQVKIFNFFYIIFEYKKFKQNFFYFQICVYSLQTIFINILIKIERLFFINIIEF